MTSDQMKTIDCLRLQGLGYRRIAEKTGINANTVKSYCQRVSLSSVPRMKEAHASVEIATEPVKATIPPVEPTTEPRAARQAELGPETITDTGTATFKPCRLCGAPVKQTPGRKEKKFCSKACSARWWNLNRYSAERKSCHQIECLTCGKAFFAYSSAGRKYCSHACYLEGRFHRGTA